MFKLRLNALGGVLFVLSFTASAPTLAAGATGAIMEEIMVYGTKRSAAQAVQDVPAQVAAYDAEKLEALHVLNIEDLSFATPNVQLDGVGTSVSFAAFSARGLGVDNSTPSIEPNVGVFVDGAYLGVPFGVITDTFDLESIEIHKGPQGLLFGRNVTGGAVLLRSRRPSGEEFELDLKTSYESGNQYAVALAVEGGLMEDTLAGRMAIQYKDDGGWFDNKHLNDNTGESTSHLVRMSLLYTPSETVDLTFIIEDGEIEGDGTPVQNLWADPPLSPLDSNGQYTYASPITPPNDEFDVRHDFVGSGDAAWTQFTFESVFDLGEGQVTNILAYRKVDAFSATDVDSRETGALNTFYFMDQDQYSNELRYNIAPKDNWDLTLGLSWFAQEYEYTTGLVVSASDLDFDMSAGRGHRRGGGQLDQTSVSLYMNNEVRINDSFSFIGGFNYSNEEKEVAIAPRLPPATLTGDTDPKVQALADVCGYATGCDWSRAVPAKDDWSNFSPKIGFVWHGQEDMQVYGHYSRAFRSGFYNFRQTNAKLLVPGPNGNGPEPTAEEEHNAIEFGIKSLLADGTVRLNAAVFNQDIDDLARSTGFVLPADGSSAQDLVTVGDARITGIEVDVLAQLGDNMVLQLAVGWLDGDITDAKSNINRVGGIDAKDEALDMVRLSELTYNLALTYDQPVKDVGVLTMSLDYGYRSESAARDDNAAFFPEMKMLGFNLRYEPNDGNWSVSAYGKNMLDEVLYKSLFPISAGRVYAPIAEGRRLGLEFRYKM